MKYEFNYILSLNVGPFRSLKLQTFYVFEYMRGLEPHYASGDVTIHVL